MGTLKWEKQNLNCRSEKQDLFLEDSVLLYIKKEKILIPRKRHVTQSL